MWGALISRIEFWVGLYSTIIKIRIHQTRKGNYDKAPIYKPLRFKVKQEVYRVKAHGPNS